MQLSHFFTATKTCPTHDILKLGTFGNLSQLLRDMRRLPDSRHLVFIFRFLQSMLHDTF